jgi:hypothetical protein
MIAYLNRYFSFVLVLSLVAPLWLAGAAREDLPFLPRFHDALVWSGVLLVFWLLISKWRGFAVRGAWRKPAVHETKLYVRLLIGALLIDFGSKALFFRWDRPGQVEIIKNFGLHSVFHETVFEPFHFFLLLYFLYVFFLGALFFRFANPSLDRVWMICCALALAGGIALFGERALFGGVHNSFYFAGPLMWICPTCASPRFSSYAWTPADLFVHAAFMPAILLAASYILPARAIGRRRRSVG